MNVNGSRSRFKHFYVYFSFDLCEAMASFEIIAGTYEEFLIGYKFNSEDQTLTQSFASHDHSSSLRTLATCDHYLASGAADDRIIIYDFKTRKEHCMLTHHTATINCLCFTHNHSHLISGSSDGLLAITRVGNWQVEKKWDKAHKGMAILDIAVHLSGKLALTLGSDGILRTWNLVKGRQAYAINLSSKSKDPKSLEKILWADDGVRFILYGGRYTEVWSIEIGGILKCIEHPIKVCSCIWFSEDEILAGYEDGQLAIINIDTSEKRVKQGHGSRIKGISKKDEWLVTVCSSGELKVWTGDLREVCKSNAGCRITCMDIISNFEVVKEEKVETDTEEIIEISSKRSGSRVVVMTENDGESDDSGKGIPVKKSKKSKKSKISKQKAFEETDVRDKKKKHKIKKIKAG
ncbi:unnamed protein product [Phaedon cochleariae]|uniref:P21-activated protein kinase-interacting protein 1-like n=1 Tax=Phaedon cochleariae TaxID=80249 RepID=A0A9P0DRU7_PHACE|nr:unnamed protein product [Phaedon cochleariae]